MRNLFSLGLFALVLGTGCGEKAGGAATLTWKQGDEWHLATQRRVANVKETARHVELDGSATADEVFDENWTDEVVWTYQVVEAAVVPAEGDELYEYAVQYDGTVGELTVVRAWIDGSLNDDSEMIESDPVIYLVFNDRNRLGGAIEFLNVDGERVESAYSTQDLDRSWGPLTQSALVSAPTYLAPSVNAEESGELTLENGSTVGVELTDAGADYIFSDEVGGGEVATSYTEGNPWPTLTVTENLEARLMDQAEVEQRRVRSGWRRNDPPPNYDFRAALAKSIDIDSALTLDADTMDGGWEAYVPDAYQPWNGSWWRLSEAALVFGYDSYRETYSGRVKAEVLTLKNDMDKIQDSLEGMDKSSADYQTKVDEYGVKQKEVVTKLVAFYDKIRADLDGGKITIADGKMTHSVDGWSYELAELSPMDKFALVLYLNGETNPNPFYMPAWELLNQWNPSGGSWWGHCNGWAAAAILTNEPTKSVTITAKGHSFEFTTADIKGLMSEAHYSTSSRFYGKRFYKEGDDVTDLTPQAFHKIVTFYVRDQQVPLVFDTTATAEVWNFPFYGVEMNVTEIGGGAGGSTKTNLNTADLAGLLKVKGIGKTIAPRIIEYRLANGPFQTLEDLKKVKGVTNYILSQMGDTVTVAATDGARIFQVSATVHFATDGVDETHVDNGTPEGHGFTKTYGYTLKTDATGKVMEGTWDNVEEHPDFAWVPYNNPLSASNGGSENPYLPYGSFLKTVGEDFVRK